MWTIRRGVQNAHAGSGEIIIATDMMLHRLFVNKCCGAEMNW